MKMKYDKEVDMLYIKLTDKHNTESDESKAGIITDYHNAVNVVGIEVLNASKK